MWVDLTEIKTVRGARKFTKIHRYPLPDFAGLCYLNKLVGLCGARLPRFFYNAEKRRCERFVYSGCGGNANNFETLDDCNRACHSQQLPQTPHQQFPRSFPNDVRSVQVPLNVNSVTSGAGEKTKGKVKGGKKSNNREFVGKSVPEPNFFTPAVCNLIPEVGICRAAFRRWFYNTRSGRCEEFIYGGCHGNENNFESEHQCYQKCTNGVKPVHYDTPNAVFPVNRNSRGRSRDSFGCEGVAQFVTCFDFKARWGRLSMGN